MTNSGVFSEQDSEIVDKAYEKFLENNELTRDMVDMLVDKGVLARTDFDDENNLEIFCNHGGNPNKESLEKICRGVVFNGSELVLRAFPYPTEVLDIQAMKNEELKSLDLKSCSIFDSYEGSLIRVFCFNGKWYTSTHRKFNANKSRWASRVTFGTHFLMGLRQAVQGNPALKEKLEKNREGSTDDFTLDEFYELLDSSMQYMFLVLHDRDNRIVCEYPEEPKMFHVGTFVDGRLSLDVDIGLPKPSQVSIDGSTDIESLDKLVDYTNNIDPCKVQGTIIFTPRGDQYKIVNKFYQDYFNVRGNEPSVPFRYLQVINDSEAKDLLRYLYPEKVEQLDTYERILSSEARRILYLYKQRFIFKEFVDRQPFQVFKVISDCHSWHKEDPKCNKIHLGKVIDVLMRQPATSLNFIIKAVLKKEREDLAAKEREAGLENGTRSHDRMLPMSANPE